MKISIRTEGNHENELAHKIKDDLQTHPDIEVVINWVIIIMDGKMKSNCKHCGTETGGANCCFPCLLKTSEKTRQLFPEMIK